MNWPLVLNPEAEADLDDAVAWYDRQRPGLGDDFLDRVRDLFQQIRLMPEAHNMVFQDLRRALVRRFPYQVIYRIDDDQITVLAVYHTKRNPRGWRNRV